MLPGGFGRRDCPLEEPGGLGGGGGTLLEAPCRLLLAVLASVFSGILE